MSVTKLPRSGGIVFITSHGHSIDNTGDNGRKQLLFHTRPAFDAPVMGGSRRNIAMTFGVKKLWLPGE